MYSEDDTLSGGLPHSEIPGSPIARISPGLFAACHVLHRLSVPRHPPDALLLRLIPGASLRKRHNTAAHRGKTLLPALAGAHKTRRPHMKTLLRTDQTPTAACTQTTAAPEPIRLGHITTLSSPFNQHARFRVAPETRLASSPNAGRGGARSWRCQMVEVNGFEPMTSCLQSRRSPN